MMRTAKPPRQARILNELIQERGLKAGHYALFFVTGEGHFLSGAPASADAIEETSGYVLDDQGRVFLFWLGWDPIHETPAFVEWREEQPESDWLNDDEYQRARQCLGLPLN